MSLSSFFDKVLGLDRYYTILGFLPKLFCEKRLQLNKEGADRDEVGWSTNRPNISTDL
jgi:hypothetical protein